MATALLYSIEPNRATVDFSYGIAPIPKYSTDQAEYRTYLCNTVTSVGVNSIISDEEQLSIIGATLEALAYHGYHSIKKSYFICIAFDESSLAVLELMYATAEIDFSGIMSSADEGVELSDHLVRPVLSSNSDITEALPLRKSSIMRALSYINVKANILPDIIYN